MLKAIALEAIRNGRLTAVSQNVQPSSIAFKRTGSDCSKLRSDPIAELRPMAPKPGTGTCCPPSGSVFVIFVDFCEFTCWESENWRSIKWRTSRLFILRPNGGSHDAAIPPAPWWQVVSHWSDSGPCGVGRISCQSSSNLSPTTSILCWVCFCHWSIFCNWWHLLYYRSVLVPR